MKAGCPEITRRPSSPYLPLLQLHERYHHKERVKYEWMKTSGDGGINGSIIAIVRLLKRKRDEAIYFEGINIVTKQFEFTI